MHDYYRIAEISGASRHSRLRGSDSPMFRPRAARSGRRASVARPHILRALEPQRAADPAWRDEIALDFPSLQASVDRMCRGFVDVDARPVRVSASIALTGDQLRRGARVPLLLDVPAVCDGCGGRGEAWGDACSACTTAGTVRVGRHVVVRVPVGSVQGSLLCYSFALPYGPPVRLDVRVGLR